VPEASTLFACEFTNGVSDPKNMIEEEVTDVQIERERDEGGIKFVDKRVGDKKFANKESGGHQGHAVRDVKRAGLILNDGRSLPVGEGDQKVLGRGGSLGRLRLFTNFFLLLRGLGGSLAGAGRFRLLTMDVFLLDLVFHFHFGLGTGEFGFGTRFRRGRSALLLSTLSSVLTGFTVVVTGLFISR
jgi:hypothetical protein